MIVKTIIIILSLIAIVSFLSCDSSKSVADTTEPKTEAPIAEENNPNDLVGKTWTVSYIQELDARTVPTKKAPSINFKEGNRASINLSVNSCIANYKASTTTLKIVNDGCTEMCCDDTFDQQLLKLIEANEFSYALSGSKLTMTTENITILLTSE